MKKLVSLLLSMLMICSLAGCGIVIDGEGGSTGSKASGASGAIGLSISTQNNPFFVTLAEGAKKAAKQAGVPLTVVDASDDATKQVSDIEDLVSKNVSVLIVNPVDSDAVTGAVEAAIAKGVRVISVDRVVTSGASAAIDRSQGFHNIADKKLKVVASQTADFDRTQGMTVMENMLQADSSIQAVFAGNDEMALGAVEAISGAKKDVLVVGFDATDDAIEAIRQGRMGATIAQQPDLIGSTAVENAIRLTKGESIPKEIPVEVTLITKDTVDK